MRESDFYAGAERRIWRFQLAFAALGIAGAWRLAGSPGAIGFAAGAAVSSLNFLWLKQAVDALAAKAVAGAGHAAVAEPENLNMTASDAPARPLGRKSRKSGSLLIWKFLGRYGLIGIVAYGTLRYTAWNVKALLAGLFLFVAAILAEICVEIAIALKQDEHGT